MCVRTIYESSRVNVKVEPRSTFTFTREVSYIVSILFTHVKPFKVYVHTHVKITRQWKSTFNLLYFIYARKIYVECI